MRSTVSNLSDTFAMTSENSSPFSGLVSFRPVISSGLVSALILSTMDVSTLPFLSSWMKSLRSRLG